MTIKILEIRKARHASCLAEVKMALTLDGHEIVIDDARVIQSRRGNWVALPSYSVSSGKDYAYYPAIVLSGGLMGETEEAVLKAFEDWKKES